MPKAKPKAKPAFALIDQRDLLIKLKTKIQNPDNWTKYVMSRDATNFPCMPIHESACRWCLLGALESIIPYARDPRAAHNILYSRLFSFTPRGSVSDFNDSSTHEEVMTFLDKVINRVETEIKQQTTPTDNAYK